jgi:hypothetical protein
MALGLLFVKAVEVARTGGPAEFERTKLVPPVFDL